MVVYSAFSQCVVYHYKTYLFSKATCILIITTFLSVMFPIIFTYRSHGFWLRTDTYQEQPKVDFKFDYLLLMDTFESADSLVCSNIPKIVQHTKKNYCPLIKAKEEDLNRDGIKDLLHFSMDITLPEDQRINGIILLLFFDFKLTSYCRLQMEGMGMVSHSSVQPGAGLSVVADLDLMQRLILDPRHIHTLYNCSVVDLTTVFSLHKLVRQYASRNVSLILKNVYTTWSRLKTPAEPFKIDMTVYYPEVTVRYKPTFWQVAKFGWMQLFPVLVIFLLLFRAIKRFIFTNQLVCTYKAIPWKNAL